MDAFEEDRQKEQSNFRDPEEDAPSLRELAEDEFSSEKPDMEEEEVLVETRDEAWTVIQTLAQNGSSVVVPVNQSAKGANGERKVIDGVRWTR